ncbi:hypothetical protein DRJ16_02155 [Candidatus Woesearchaeota archaeon]|nr:MAG: hypothetical protein DRJ16_02155 [Candidatus Woesearchaeota archaeon]
MASIVSIIAAIAGLASAGAGVAQMTRSAPKPKALPPMPSEKKAAQIAQETVKRRRLAGRGRAATILTGGMGVTEPPPILRPTMGG